MVKKWNIDWDLPIFVNSHIFMICILISGCNKSITRSSTVSKTRRSSPVDHYSCCLRWTSFTHSSHILLMEGTSILHFKFVVNILHLALFRNFKIPPLHLLLQYKVLDPEFLGHQRFWILDHLFFGCKKKKKNPYNPPLLPPCSRTSHVIFVWLAILRKQICQWNNSFKRWKKVYFYLNKINLEMLFLFRCSIYTV